MDRLRADSIRADLRFAAAVVVGAPYQPGRRAEHIAHIQRYLLPVLRHLCDQDPDGRLRDAAVRPIVNRLTVVAARHAQHRDWCEFVADLLKDVSRNFRPGQERVVLAMSLRYAVDPLMAASLNGFLAGEFADQVSGVDRTWWGVSSAMAAMAKRAQAAGLGAPWLAGVRHGT